ncbi:MAG: c-type cytochrome [Oligoflexus sp.]
MKKLFAWSICCLMATACTCQEQQTLNTEQPADRVDGYQSDSSDDASDQNASEQAMLEEHIKQMREAQEKTGGTSQASSTPQKISAGENKGTYQTYDEVQQESSIDTPEGQKKLAQIIEQKSKYVGSKQTLPDPLAIYAQHCARCHGVDGRGNGPDEASLGIVPTNFHEAELKFGSSIEHLVYSTKYGQSEEEMPSFSKTLKDEEIWSVSLYIQEWLQN